ncbi:hypothetical protein OFC53_29780, partial [Escherichia coli]|nr:hypothetical protein [Escherichia coli]
FNLGQETSDGVATDQLKEGNGHKVAYLYCTSDLDGKHKEVKCHIAIFGSPRNSTNHAKKSERPLTVILVNKGRH